MRWRAWGGCVALGSDGVVAGVGWEEGGVLREIPWRLRVSSQRPSAGVDGYSERFSADKFHLSWYSTAVRGWGRRTAGGGGFDGFTRFTETARKRNLRLRVERGTVRVLATLVDSRRTSETLIPDWCNGIRRSLWDFEKSFCTVGTRLFVRACWRVKGDWIFL